MQAFPFDEGRPVEHCAALPERADVVIIGGGIVGVMTGYYLAERGLRAVVCEKGRIAGEQSSRNWGWVRQQGRDPAELPLMIEANRIWRDLSKTLDLGFRQTGVLYLANRPDDMAPFEAWMAHARAHDLDTRLLNRAEVAALVPSSADWHGAILTPSDGRAEPWQAVPALARAAAARGVMIREGCAVRRLDMAAGRIAGVITEAGRIACDQVVVAGGAWSSLFLRAHGIDLPQLSVLASVAATGPLPEVFAGQAADSRFAFRRRADGGYTLAPCGFHEIYVGPDAFRHLRKYLPQLRADPLGTRPLPAAPAHFPDAWGTPRGWAGDEQSPFERIRILNPRPNRRALARVQDSFAAAFPAIGRPALARTWAGMIDTMPDVVPVIDRAGPAGLIVATGLSGHGFGIGPAIGRVVADIAAERAPGHDLHRFRYSRFSDGSPVVLGPSL
ncbi:MAG: FAD-dependent oxidoreductase [Paracoccaceae bacterium]